MTDKDERIEEVRAEINQMLRRWLTDPRYRDIKMADVMQGVKVDIGCYNCDSPDGGELPNMEPGEVMFVNTEAGTQARKYECPLCGVAVLVTLTAESEASQPKEL